MRKYTLVACLLAVFTSGCGPAIFFGDMAAELHSSAKNNCIHLQAIGEIQKIVNYDSFFEQMTTACSNGGLTILASNKEVRNLAMEKLQNDQVMRFSAQISEKKDSCFNEKYTVILTQDYKLGTTKNILIRNAIAIYSNLQEVTGINSENINITIENKTLTLIDWIKESGIKR